MRAMRWAGLGTAPPKSPECRSTGAVRISTGREEHHTAENPASTPSDFLRILLKTDSAGERTMYRLQPSEDSFDNKQLRITRLNVVQNWFEELKRLVPTR